MLSSFEIKSGGAFESNVFINIIYIYIYVCVFINGVQSPRVVSNRVRGMMVIVVVVGRRAKSPRTRVDLGQVVALSP